MIATALSSGSVRHLAVVPSVPKFESTVALFVVVVRYRYPIRDVGVGVSESLESLSHLNLHPIAQMGVM